MHPAIFLDRDGVIIENRDDYVRSWEDVSIFPQALEALVKSSASLYKIVLITNQSAVGRELITLETAWEINQRLVEGIRSAGGRVDGVYLCPHAPEQDCDCRKPKPGLILQAAHELDIDLGRSIMIGDALTDIMAGQAAGVGHLAIVRSGRGARQIALPRPHHLAPFLVFDTLADALDNLLSVGEG
jgi:D-glycero-D-manno-heptose 1,7-bisphosphate phosphatase